MDIKKLYTKFKVFDLMKNVKFYGRVKSFFRYFIITKLFKELDKLEPMRALEAFLKMFPFLVVLYGTLFFSNQE